MNSWNSFKEHHELKSDRYEEDQNIIIKLHSFEYIKGYIDKDEAKEFDYQLFYPIIRIPKRFFLQITKEYTLEKRYDTDDVEHFYFEDILDVCKYLKLPGNWSYLSPPIKESPPTKDVISTERRVDKKQSLARKYGCGFSIWLFMFLVFNVIPEIVNPMVGILPLFLISLPFLILVMFVFKGDGKTSSIKSYTKEEITNIEEANNREYNEKLLKYNESVKNYSILLEQFENDKRAQLASIEKNSLSIYSQLWSNCMKSTLVYERTDSPPQRGSYENALFYELMKKYPNYVKIDTKVGPYYPDIVISIKDEVFIDIEVDEPYVFNTKKEAHYIHSGDIRRNKFFTDNNWFVIRFAECQLINDMDKCVSFVDSIIQFILTGDTQHIESATELKESFLVKRWTKEEARMMAIEDIRKTNRNYPTR